MKRIYNFFSKKFIFGFLIIMIFYLTVGFVAAYIILSAIANQTHSTISIFENWWQLLIFILDIICVLLLGLSIFSMIKTRKKEEDVYEEAKD